jgi:MoxR-like ATPase
MDHNLEYLKIHMDLADTLGKYYINSTPVLRLNDLDLLVHDLAAAAILSVTGTYLMGTRGSGKTLLAEAVWKAVMNEEGLYLRGDKDLTLKDLYMELNLDGKTEAEIYGISSERIRHVFTLVDEMNRCIGLVQNQFFNIADGYIEIRGKKYYLGKADQDYSLMFATGNPPTNGEHPGVFDEDVALVDRIGLILNVNDYPLNEDDTAAIKSMGITKRSIEPKDMREDVLKGNRILAECSGRLTTHYLAVLAAYLEQRFRYIESGGKRYDKTKVDWRMMLQPGSHGSGDAISYASDISQRAQQENRMVEALLLYYSAFKSTEGESELSTGMIRDCYLDSLMLSLRYDRRFLPFEYIEDQHHGDAKEYLDKIKQSLRNEVNAEILEDCGGALLNADEALRTGKPEMVQQLKEYVEDQYKTDPIARTTIRILDQKNKKRLHSERKDKVRDAIRKKLRSR